MFECRTMILEERKKKTGAHLNRHLKTKCYLLEEMCRPNNVIWGQGQDKHMLRPRCTWAILRLFGVCHSLSDRYRKLPGKMLPNFTWISRREYCLIIISDGLIHLQTWMMLLEINQRFAHCLASISKNQKFSEKLDNIFQSFCYCDVNYHIVNCYRFEKLKASE